MVLARSGGYCPQRQQQRQAPDAVRGIAGLVNAGRDRLRRQLQRHQHAGSRRYGRGDGQCRRRGKSAR